MGTAVAPAVIGGPASRAACAQFAAPPWAWGSCRLAVIPVRAAAPAGPPGAPLVAGGQKGARSQPLLGPLLQKDPAVVQV